MGVCLSTVHKAKGLESENVYILCNSSMPSKLAVHDWEKQQEKISCMLHTPGRKIRWVLYPKKK